MRSYRVYCSIKITTDLVQCNAKQSLIKICWFICQMRQQMRQTYNLIDLVHCHAFHYSNTHPQHCTKFDRTIQFSSFAWFFFSFKLVSMKRWLKKHVTMYKYLYYNYIRKCIVLPSLVQMGSNNFRQFNKQTYKMNASKSISILMNFMYTIYNLFM